MKIKPKFIILLGVTLLLVWFAFVLFDLIPAWAIGKPDVEINETQGQVLISDPMTGEFGDAGALDKILVGQKLLTKENSWARLSFFGDGTSLHADPFTSFSLSGIGEQNGIRFARLQLDIGRLYMMPLGTILYTETEGGIVFADTPATVVSIWVDAESKQTYVYCLEGICKINNRSGSVLLSKGQEATLSDNDHPPEILSSIGGMIAEGKDQAGEDAGIGSMEQVLEQSALNIMEPNLEDAPPKIDCGPPLDWEIYQVEPEDTYEGLLKSYAVSGEEFRKANCLGDMQVVVAGLNLFVPPVPPIGIEAASMSVTFQPNLPIKETQTPTLIQNSQEVALRTEQVELPEDSQAVVMRDVPITKNNDYVSNPGMGWQYRGGTFPTTYPDETVAYSKRAHVSWKILNPSEGLYDWTALDSQLQTAISQGKQFSFRVYTMIGEEFGNHQVPQWVLDKGAVLLPNGEPDYSNCTYQQEWGNFVNKLIQRYDGEPEIAFIDISGYGNFNEWSWQDSQTVWDDVWAAHYSKGTASRDTMSTMDSFARRVLADMFIGGSYQTHQCTEKNGSVKMTSYSYPGFSMTQLVMPYAGIIQSSQYVFNQRKDVGFRHDCLGRTSSNKVVAPDRFGLELKKIWPKAPVVFETCKSGEFSMENANYLVQSAHASLVHDVNLDLDTGSILSLVKPLGYQYELLTFRHSFKVPPGGQLTAYMEWQNVGLAPSYPKMGQHFELHVYFYDRNGNVLVDYLVPEDISSWLPASKYGDKPPVYPVSISIEMGEDIPPGIYYANAKIIDARTGQPIWILSMMDSK